VADKGFQAVPAKVTLAAFQEPKPAHYSPRQRNSSLHLPALVLYEGSRDDRQHPI